MVDDFLYSIDIFTQPNSPDNVMEPLPVGVIEQRLKAAVDDALSRLEAGEEAVKVGILTADERDTWTKVRFLSRRHRQSLTAQNRERLLLLSPKNREILNRIDSSLLCLCLDPYTLPSLTTTDPLHNAAVDAQIRNCASGIHGARNRWFDKAISVLLENNGRGGIMGEHSPVDALIPSIVVEYVLGEPVDEAKFGDAQGGDGGWNRLDWVVDAGIKGEIEECQGRNRKLIDDSDASQLWWGEYGVEWIKKHGEHVSARLFPMTHHFGPQRSNRLTRTFSRLSSLHGTATKGTPRPRTRRPRRG
jgi:carnitine O-acetyltransferase